MIIYIITFCSFMTIFSFHIPTCKNINLPFSYENIKNRNKETGVIHSLDLNLINDDDEFQEVVGYEATEKIKEKLPNSLEYLSQKLVRSLLHHDLTVINKKTENYKPKWLIRNDRNRFDTCYYKIGEKVLGRVSKVFPTYALIDIGCTKYGVLHARDMSKGWVDRVDLTLTPKEDIHVYVKSINEQYNTIKLSLIPPEDRDGLTEKDDNCLSEVQKSDERKSITDYEVEELVKGVIVRVSPLGYYVDIGASVDAFLHISDIKVTDKMRKSYAGRIYKDRNKYKIGGKLNELYIKSIDIIKNRIGLTENTLFEELERNVMTGKETPEQQSSYLRNYSLDFMKELRVRDIESLKSIGGYDEYLKSLKADRNASVDYLLYLENLKEQKELEDIQKNLFRDLSTKQKIKNDQKYFNELAHRIIDLSNMAFPPTEDEKSIYKYADTKVWNSNVYTRFIASSELKESSKQPCNRTSDEKVNSKQFEVLRRRVNKKYFKTLADEIKNGLMDVQGENFDFSEKYEEFNSYDEPYKLINYLFDQFHKKPSNISVQTDKHEYKRQYVHSSNSEEYNFPSTDSVSDQDLFLENDPVLWKERLEMKERQMAEKEKFINELLNSKDKNEAELGQLLLETKDFDPFEHCNTLNESEESCFKGASNLFKDDVSKWNDRVHKLVLDNKITLPEFREDIDEFGQVNRHDSDRTLDDDDIEDIDPDILKALDENYDDKDFTAPKIEDYIDGNSEEHEFMEDIDPDYEEDSPDYQDLHEDDLYLKDCPNLQEYKTLGHQPKANESLDVLQPTEGNKQFYDENFEINPRIKRENISVKKFIDRLRKDKSFEKFFITHDSPLTKLISEPKQTNLNSSKSPTQIDDRARGLIDEIKHTALKIVATGPIQDPNPSISTSSTDDSTPRANLCNLSTSSSSSFTNSDPHPVDYSSNYGNLSSELKSSFVDDQFKVPQVLDRSPIEKYSLSKLQEKNSIDDDSESLNLFSNKKDFKMLIKYAKQHLTPNDLAAIPKLLSSNNEYEEERLMNILRSVYKQTPKSAKYTFYPEGIDAHLQRQEEAERSDARIAAYKTEMTAKLRILLRNKNFINMLKRLNVDPKVLNSRNITQLLPQQFKFQRLTPSSQRREF